MFPKDGYWRSEIFTEKFYSCLRADSCIGHDNYTNYLGECETGYEGPLCQSCKDEYSRSAKNTCVICPDLVSNIVRAVGLAIGMILGAVLMIRSTIQAANKSNRLFSVYLKIFANYL
jgi:hypothetical protein